MATTHYSFPTINGTDTIDGVNAINGLANAVDTALYQVEQEGGSAPGANSITTSMIQNGAVTSEKLSNGAVTSEKLASAVQNNITRGNQAFTTLNLPGERTPITSWEDANGFTATAHNGFYVVYPSAKILVVKINIQGSLNLSQNIPGTICTATLPTQYSVPYSYQTMCGFSLHPSDALPISYDIIYDGNKVMMNAINYGARSGVASGIAVTGTVIIPYQPLSS